MSAPPPPPLDSSTVFAPIPAASLPAERDPVAELPPWEWLDALVGLVPLLLAGLLALTSAANSDLWLRLASGRQILASGLFPAADPFAYTLPPGSTRQPGWLADVGGYLVYQALGGSALVVGKIILVMGVAACLLWLARCGRYPLTAFLGVTLALLALATRLPLNPVCLSYLFLALTLVILEASRRRKPGLPPQSAFAQLWPLAPLFILWANLDSWAFLGPLTVGLYALGGWLGRRVRPAEEGAVSPTSLGLFFLVGLAACLLTPSSVGSFRWPAELASGAFGRVLRDDPSVRVALLSPLQPEFYRLAGGFSAGTVAFLVLVGLGAATGLVNRKEMSWPLAFVWGGFLALTLFRARAIPFFALAAGPFAALNLGQLLSPAAELPRRVVRLGALLAGVALLVMAWPGWLQPAPYEGRGWRVEPDPSCERLAQHLRSWRQAGLLPESVVGFNVSPQTGSQLAWLLPGERSYVDSRLPLFDPTIGEFAAVRRGLREGSSTTVRDVFRERRIGYVVLTNSDQGDALATFRNLLGRPEEWQLLGIEGNLAVFGWRGTPELTIPPFDPRPRVYGRPEPVADVPRSEFHPGPLPHWSDVFSWNRPMGSADTDEAALDLVFFDAVRLRRLGQFPRVWDASCAAGLVADAGRPGLTLISAALLGAWGQGVPGEEAAPGRRLGSVLWIDWSLRRDEGPPSALYLTIRSARRALRANPADWRAQLLLGEAYTRLSRQTTERLIGRARDHDLSLNFLRQVQTVVAFNQALLSRPNLVRAHAALCAHYQDMGYLDLALTHLRAWLRSARAGGPQGDETADDFAARVADLRAREEKLESAVEEARRRFAATPANLPLAERAETARQFGLAETALAMLEKSNVAAFGAAGAALELRLFLLTGRVREVDAWLVPELASLLGTNQYHKLRYLLAGALGNGEDADRHLDELAQAFRLVGAESDKAQSRPPLRLVLALAVGQVLLDEPILGRCAIAVAWHEDNRARSFQRMRDWAVGLVQEADITTLRGLLALEQGRVEQATALFQQALALWPDTEPEKRSARLDFPNRPLAVRHLNRLLRAARGGEIGGE